MDGLINRFLLSYSVDICIFLNLDYCFIREGNSFVEKGKKEKCLCRDIHGFHSFLPIVYFLWINERFHVIHHFCQWCGRMGNWFENLITTAIKIMRRSVSKRNDWRLQSISIDENDWLESLFTWFGIELKFQF